MSTSDTPKEVSNLTQDAEEFIKAASAHVETTSIELSQEAVQVLKQLVLVSSSMEAKLDDLNQSIHTQMKHQRIDWALKNCHSYEYFHGKLGDMLRYDLNLIKKILSAFRQNCGYDITANEFRNADEFRKAITNQLFQLLPGRNEAAIGEPRRKMDIIL